MRFVKDTPLEIGFRSAQLRPPTPSLTFVVKGTFELVPDAPARLSEEQRFPAGEAFVDDDPTQPLRSGSDYALLKPRGECLLVGEARAPRGEPVTMLPVAFASVASTSGSWWWAIATGRAAW